jgi:hypothetical protein
LPRQFNSYTFPVEPKSLINLTDVSFDEFVAFLFDHEINPDAPAQPEKYDPWYFHVETEFDAKKIAAYYVRMFRQPAFLLNRFTKEQLEEGFWAIQGPNLNCAVSRIIEDPDLAISLKEECIRSMAELFKRLFATEPFDSSVQMWWDSLCYDWHCGNRRRELGGEDLKLQDIYFNTLSEVLAIDSWICQGAALHGLGHLHHPRTKKLIERFVDEHPTLTQEQKTYAVAAAKFEVQ